jgi:hypothetical protein
VDGENYIIHEEFSRGRPKEVFSFAKCRRRGVDHNAVLTL